MGTPEIIVIRAAKHFYFLFILEFWFPLIIMKMIRGYVDNNKWFHSRVPTHIIPTKLNDIVVVILLLFNRGHLFLFLLFFSIFNTFLKSVPYIELDGVSK